MSNQLKIFFKKSCFSFLGYLGVVLFISFFISSINKEEFFWGQILGFDVVLIILFVFDLVFDWIHDFSFDLPT